jgi:hypothetical protein
MILPDWVRRLFSSHPADRLTGGAARNEDDLGPDLQLLEVAQVPDLSGGMWLIVDRESSVQARESAGPR